MKTVKEHTIAWSFSRALKRMLLYSSEDPLNDKSICQEIYKYKKYRVLESIFKRRNCQWTCCLLFCFSFQEMGNRRLVRLPLVSCTISWFMFPFFQVEAFKTHSCWFWLSKTDIMVSEKDVLVAAAVFVFALISHSELMLTLFLY